jgi:hypothetical protein
VPGARRLGLSGARTPGRSAFAIVGGGGAAAGGVASPVDGPSALGGGGELAGDVCAGAVIVGGNVTAGGWLTDPGAVFAAAGELDGGVGFAAAGGRLKLGLGVAAAGGSQYMFQPNQPSAATATTTSRVPRPEPML